MFDTFLLVIVLGVLAIITSAQSRQVQQDCRYRRNACILLCILFIIQATGRDFETQLNDTLNYVNHYNAVTQESLKDLIQSFSFIADSYGSRDPGFWIFVKLTQYISTDFRVFLFIVASIISIPICRILYKYSTSLPGIFIGAVLYEALFANFFETGIRQTVAMGLTYMALELYLNKKYIWVLLLTLLAYTIHTSALIFIPVYAIIQLNNPRKILATAILIAPIFMIFAKPILFFMGEDTIMEQYTSLDTEDNLGTPVFSFMVLATAIMVGFYGNKIRQTYKYPKLIFATMACAIMTVPTTWVNSNFLRLSLYFLAFLMPLISVFIDILTENNRKLSPIYYTTIAALLSILSY